MKVYIVVDAPSYEQSTIVAVCSTKEIAEQYIKNNYKSRRYDIDIEEWVIDEKS